MDKIQEKEKKNDAPRDEGLGARVKTIVSSIREGGIEDKGALLFNLSVFTVALLFARCHVAFGAHPLGVAIVSLMPFGTFASLLGAFVGSITLGSEGIIYAVCSTVAVFLRMIMSHSGSSQKMFGEGVGLRMASSVVGGFVCAAYEILLSGFSISSVLFSSAMILLPPISVFLLSGLFTRDVDLTALFADGRAALSLSRRRESEKQGIIFFQLSALAALFFTSLSLVDFELFGISLSYIFVAFVTLVSAKRFGALRALTVGFVSSLGSAGVYSVSFGLAGLGAGLIFGLGSSFALILGGVLFALWSAYVGGLTGFLEALPEYLIAAALAAPLCKGISPEKTPEEEIVTERSAKDMASSVAMKYRSGISDSLSTLESSLAAIGGLIREYSDNHKGLTVEEYKNIVLDVAAEYCKNCEELPLCTGENIRPCAESADIIVEKLLKRERITPELVNGAMEFCQRADEVAEEIMRRAARAEREEHRQNSPEARAEEYELIARLINEARANDEAERRFADELTEPLTEVARNFGFEDGVIRALGTRKKHIILAGEDEGGERISSKDLRLGIERVAGVKLSQPEYYKNGKMALMECDTRRAFAVECASARLAGDEDEISGDSIALFESEDDRFFAILSDGMGSGETARDTSEFVAAYLRRALDFGASKDTVLHLLNHAMRSRHEECSATVDLFEMDLLLGEAVFIKSGAAPSFVKRDGSIFRIKSQTAPIGLMKSIDTEKIRVEVQSEDIVVMLSDGIIQSAEESPWLLELLSEKPPRDLKEYADLILTEAKKYSASRDDMSVIVLRIIRI